MAQAKTQAKAAKAKAAKKPPVVAHKNKMTANRQNIKATVVAFLPPIKDAEGRKTGFGQMIIKDAETGKLGKPTTIKMLYGKQAETFRNITEVITPSSYATGDAAKYSYKYVVSKADYIKQNKK